MTTTFIYALCEPGTRTIRYIGKSGNPEKRFCQHLIRSKRAATHLGAWLRKVEKPELLILRSIPVSEWEWWEQSYIRNARMLGFDLVNTTPGGEGLGSGVLSPLFGRKHTKETRQKLSESHKGKKHTDATRQKMSDDRKGRTFTDETRRKIGAASKGRKHTEESRHKMSVTRIGRKHTDETRLKMSAAHTGRKFTEETRRKISIALKGRKHHC